MIGVPIPQPEIEVCAGDRKAMMDFLRARTYALCPKPIDPGAFGFEFEAMHRRSGRDGGRDF